MQQQRQGGLFSPLQRIRIWYALLLLICGVVLVRLFYLQIIRHDHYKTVARQGQLKEYELPAGRGIIEVHNGSEKVAIVLNESKYTLFSDPKFIKDSADAAKKIAREIGGNEDDYKKLMEVDTRYSILAKKLNEDQKKAIEKLELKGVGLREVPYRTYPQGTLAAQLLGFVNDEGQGVYGVEEALNNDLTGTPGLLKAITDARGVPLAANDDNLLVEPKTGKRVLLTIDLGMQQNLEEILKTGLEQAQAKSGSAVIIEAKTGAVKAMANFPTYNPAEFFNEKNPDVFNNAVVSSPLEVGSIMKPLTAAAALDQGVINRNTSYFDPFFVQIGDARVTNVAEAGGAGQKTVQDILQQSLNTGATWLLMQMGGGEINEKARVAWHSYMTTHYGFGQKTGIEQGFEEPGSIPDPVEGFGLNIQFANTTFGQGMTATPLQMAAAIASVVNGGTYYQPRLVDAYTSHDGVETVVLPKAVRQNVVSPAVGKDIKELMEYVMDENGNFYGLKNPRSQYLIGGKTGSAQIPKPEGGYYDDRFNGTFMGFVGGDEAQYVIVIRVSEPKIAGYAGSRAAAPIFVRVAESLIDNFGVTPKSN